MIAKTVRVFLFLGVMFLAGCSDGCVNGYYKCDGCGAVYRSSGGLPGQAVPKWCRGCGGRLHEVSKQRSGWDDDRYRRNGNEIE